MKINPKFQVHKVAGENLILLQGKSSTEMTRVMAFNDSSLLLWNRLFEKEFSLADVTNVLLEEYDVSESIATSDAERWVTTLRENGLLLTE